MTNIDDKFWKIMDPILIMFAIGVLILFLLMTFGIIPIPST